MAKLSKINSAVIIIGHAAVVGCSWCKKNFPGGFCERNYGGFKRETWVGRTNEQHRS